MKMMSKVVKCMVNGGEVKVSDATKKNFFRSDAEKKVDATYGKKEETKSFEASRQAAGLKNKSVNMIEELDKKGE